jgi:hypothetical protein
MSLHKEDNIEVVLTSNPLTTEGDLCSTYMIGSPNLRKIRFAVQMVPKQYCFDDLSAIAAHAKVVFIGANIVSIDETLCVLQFIYEDKTAHFQIVQGSDDQALEQCRALGEAGMHVIMNTFKPGFVLVTQGSNTQMKTSRTEITYPDDAAVQNPVSNLPTENIRVYLDNTHDIPEKLLYFLSLFK